MRPYSTSGTCYPINVPDPWRANVQSFQLSFNITDETLPASNNVVVCSKLSFFSGQFCSGSSRVLANPMTGLSSERYSVSDVV